MDLSKLKSFNPFTMIALYLIVTFVVLVTACFMSQTASADVIESAVAAAQGVDKFAPLFDWVGTYWAIISTVMAIATFITTLTPTTADDKVVALLLRVLNLMAGNVGKNKNLDEVIEPELAESIADGTLSVVATHDLVGLDDAND